MGRCAGMVGKIAIQFHHEGSPLMTRQVVKEGQIGIAG